MKLTDLGWNPTFETHFAPHGEQNLRPGRVVREDKLRYTVWGENGTLSAAVSGRLRHGATSAADLPAVGDWVAIAPRPAEGRATIHAVLPRKSAFTRKAAGSGVEEQVAAANVDTVFLVSGLDGDFNPRRIERYLTAVWNSGAAPVIVLNKADICEDAERRVAEIESSSLGAPIHAISAATGLGLDSINAYLKRGQTVALLGSSGVGKSTLINTLLGEEVQRTKAVRADDDHGRHTTTHRELFVLPAGGLIIDTPGMRELQLWSDDGDGLAASFDDIEELAARCRFGDCGHEHEPGCTVRAAVEDGTLDAGRLASYRKLQRELRYAAIRNDPQAQLIQKIQWKKIHKAMKKNSRMRKRW